MRLHATGWLVALLLRFVCGRPLSCQHEIQSNPILFNPKEKVHVQPKSNQPSPDNRVQRAWRRGQHKLGAALTGVALTLALSSAPAAQAMPIAFEAQINGSDCLLVDAITAANTDTATGDCNAGNPGADTIELLDNVTLFTAIGTVGTPPITSIITLNGNGFTIARDAGAPDFGILAVAAGGDLTLNTTTITGGRFFPDAEQQRGQRQQRRPRQ